MNMIMLAMNAWKIDLNGWVYLIYYPIEVEIRMQNEADEDWTDEDKLRWKMVKST